MNEQTQIRKPPLVIIAGPTAAGKTDISIELAKRINARIISADSMQVYRGFDIGSAKITPGEMKGVRHYLIDEMDYTEEFNVYEFQQRSRRYIKEITAAGCIPMIVGGTGFYIQAVLYSVDFAPSDTTAPGRSYRTELEELAREKGASYIHSLLEEADPLSAAAIHENNIKRTIRALEFHHETGGSMAVHNAVQRENQPEYDFTYFVLNRNREVIYSRINRRVDLMIEQGLVKEVEGLLRSGVPRGCLAMQGLGYKEIAAYLAGEISLEEAVYLIKRDTRHFAKRQLTWFRRERGVTWINYEDFEDQEQMLAHMIDVINRTTA